MPEFVATAVPDKQTTPPTPLGGDAAAAAAEAAQQPSSRQELDAAEWTPGPSDLGPNVMQGLNKYLKEPLNGVFLVTPSGWRDAVWWLQDRLQAKEPLPSGVGAVVVDADAAGWDGPEDTPGGTLLRCSPAARRWWPRPGAAAPPGSTSWPSARTTRSASPEATGALTPPFRVR